MGTRSANIKTTITMTGAATNQLSDNGIAYFNLSDVIVKEFKNGIAASQVDRLWQDIDRSLAVGTETIDLYDFVGNDIGAGAGVDGLGQPMVVEEIAFMLINNKSTTGTLLVGGEGTAAAFSSLFNGSDTSVLTVPPLGVLLLAVDSKPGYDIQDTSNHLLKFEAVTDTVTYDIVVAGRSA